MILNNFLKNINNKLKPGFTLIELTTSLIIISIILGLFLVNYRQVERQVDLSLTTQILVSDIRFAQANSLGLFEYDKTMPIGGWGVNFNLLNNDRYIIFADIDGEKAYSGPTESDINLGGKIITLSTDLEIFNLKVDNINVEQLNIVFLPPDPRTFINKEYIDNTSATITLRNKNNNELTNVLVNFSGLIEVVN